MVTSTAKFGPTQQLVRAEKLFHLGRYRESLKILEECNQDPAFAYMHCEHASALLLSARNSMHMGMDNEAAKYIDSIPEIVFEYNPLLYADKCIITGILKRRKSRRYWKAGQQEDALLCANEAIKEFNLGEAASARQSNCERYHFNAKLNKEYAKGLILAINKAPGQHYMPLLTDAIIAEAHSRKYMNKENRDLVSGTTIIADLALGAGLDIENIANLSSAQEYTLAFRQLFGRNMNSWPEYILSMCRGFPVTPDSNSKVINIEDSPGASQDSIAKALILGLRILLRKENIDPDLVVMYSTDLYFSARLLERNNTSHDTVNFIYQMINSIPKHLYQLSRYRMHVRMFD